MPDDNGHEQDLELELPEDETCENCEAPMLATCQSCGMPMINVADHGGGDKENEHCVHCCRPDGTLRDYDEVLETTIGMMMNNRGMGRDEAEKAAKGYLTTMPAWSGH